MRRALALLLLPVVALAQTPTEPGPAAPPPVPIDARLTGRGERVYGRFCVSCHGERGDGHGPSAPWLDPRPRDFTRGIFKWRSTPSGSLPTDADLMRTVRSGLYHTNMPSWEVLGDRNLRAAVEYLKTFSPVWKQQGPAAPITIPPEPADDAASRKRGGELYQTLGCFNCHGPQGRGDGPAVADLKDDWGYKITPYDFTSGGHLKCGDRPADLYKVFMTGLTGTPMPSFADTMSPEDAWNLVHFLRSLGSRSVAMEKPAR
jgi:cytochrome c oxidase cbb3-type subunit I/II